MRMGIPHVVTTDNGREFKNELDKELSKQLGIKRIFTTPYHPQVYICFLYVHLCHAGVSCNCRKHAGNKKVTLLHISFLQANGLDERFNQTLQKMLTKYVHDKKEVWDNYLDTCIYAYNTAVHESTSFSPFELMFGRKAVLPVELDMEEREAKSIIDEHAEECNKSDNIQLLTDQRLQNLQLARENILKVQEKQKEIYDRKHASPTSFRAGKLRDRHDCPST